MSAETYKLVGNQLLQAQQYKAAVEQYANGLGIEPDNVKILSNRAVAYMFLEEYENAAQDARKAIEVNPEFAKGYLRLAMAEKELQQFENSISHFTKYLDMLPKEDPSREEIENKILTMEEEIRQQQQINKRREREAKKNAKLVDEETTQQQQVGETNDEKKLEKLENKPEKIKDEKALDLQKSSNRGGTMNKVLPEETIKSEDGDNGENVKENYGELLEEPVVEDVIEEGPPCCSMQWWEEYMHVGNIANLIGLIVLIIGFVLKSMKIRPLDQYVYNCGMFAFSGGVTNWIAIKMLFDKVPGLYGSGVIPSRFVQIRITVKKMVMKNFFDETYLNYYLKKKVMGMDIEKMLDDLIKKHNVTDMVVEMAIADPKIAQTAKDLLKPYVLKMASKIAPLITKAINEVDFGSGMAVATVELEEMLDAKLLTLTPNRVKKMLEDIIRIHLYWLVVWGVIFGGLLGILSAALQLP